MRRGRFAGVCVAVLLMALGAGCAPGKCRARRPVIRSAPLLPPPPAAAESVGERDEDAEGVVLEVGYGPQVAMPTWVAEEVETVTERVEVAPGHWEERTRNIVTRPGHYEVGLVRRHTARLRVGRSFGRITHVLFLDRFSWDTQPELRPDPPTTWDAGPAMTPEGWRNLRTKPFGDEPRVEGWLYIRGTGGATGPVEITILPGSDDIDLGDPDRTFTTGEDRP